MFLSSQQTIKYAERVDDVRFRQLPRGAPDELTAALEKEVGKTHVYIALTEGQEAYGVVALDRTPGWMQQLRSELEATGQYRVVFEVGPICIAGDEAMSRSLLSSGIGVPIALVTMTLLFLARDGPGVRTSTALRYAIADRVGRRGVAGVHRRAVHGVLVGGVSRHQGRSRSRNSASSALGSAKFLRSAASVSSSIGSDTNAMSFVLTPSSASRRGADELESRRSSRNGVGEHLLGDQHEQLVSSDEPRGTLQLLCVQTATRVAEVADREARRQRSVGQLFELGRNAPVLELECFFERGCGLEAEPALVLVVRQGALHGIAQGHDEAHIRQRLGNPAHGIGMEDVRGAGLSANDLRVR